MKRFGIILLALALMPVSVSAETYEQNYVIDLMDKSWQSVVRNVNDTEDLCIHLDDYNGITVALASSEVL